LEIRWLGHASFHIRSGDLHILTDPFSPALGIPGAFPRAHIVTVSHPHPHHGATEAVPGNPKVLHGPGEYEIAGVFIRGMKTTLQPQAGDGGRNTVYTFGLEGIVLCHLGDLGAVPTPAQVEGLGPVHILLAPAGGTCTISPSEATSLPPRRHPHALPAP
jgi:L-ascorbate metabolism protein UlaG (beta-lactamase superfamily)